MNRAQQRITVEQRRQQVAVMYLHGQFQSTIARELGISQQSVSVDLKRLRKEWLASAVRDFDEAKSVELAKIDELERTYWTGWENSLKQREITVSKRRTGKTPGDEASVRRETPMGDARFLDGVLRCITLRCDLLGFSTSTEAVKSLGNSLAGLLVQAEAQVAVSPSVSFVEA